MDYVVIRTKRRTIALQITKEGKAVVRAPLYAPQSRIDEFVSSKSAWAQRHIDRILSETILPKYTAEEIKGFMRAARAVLPEKTEFFAKKIGVCYGRVSVRAQRTLWGSCTAKGNLNFNCLLVNVPEKVFEYVVIHELCHRKYMNHSQAFWHAVEKFCPEYKIYRKWLKLNGSTLLKRL